MINTNVGIHKEGVSIRDAPILIAKWFDIKSEKKEPQATTPEPPEAVDEVPATQESQPEASTSAEEKEDDTGDSENEPLTFSLKDLDPAHNSIDNAGFNPDTASYFEEGYHGGKGIMKDRTYRYPYS